MSELLLSIPSIIIGLISGIIIGIVGTIIFRKNFSSKQKKVRQTVLDIIKFIEIAPFIQKDLDIIPLPDSVFVWPPKNPIIPPCIPGGICVDMSTAGKIIIPNDDNFYEFEIFDNEKRKLILKEPLNKTKGVKKRYKIFDFEKKLSPTSNATFKLTISNKEKSETRVIKVDKVKILP